MFSRSYLEGVNWVEKLNKVIGDAGQEQQRLARAVGVDPSTVSRWLAGKYPPKLFDALRVADFYGMSVEQLFKDGVDLPAEIKIRIETQSETAGSTRSTAGESVKRRVRQDREARKQHSPDRRRSGGA